DEGTAMLRALLEDFARIPDIEVTTLLHEGRQLPMAGVDDHRIDAAEEEAAFRAQARGADATLVVAPEFDNILFERCCWVEEVGGRLLGPSSEIVKLTADKLDLERHLRSHGVPTTTSRILGQDDGNTR